MPLADIARKLLNAAGGFWDSLDDVERKVVLFYAAYVLVAVLGTVASRRREVLKQEIKQELLAGRVG